METNNNNKSILSTISASSNFWIDDDLWADILKRLPVKTLGRFRCVCKSWYSFISSSLFINLHHSSSTTPPNLKPYLLHQHNSTTYTLCHPQQDSFELRFPFRPVEDLKRMNLVCVDVIHGVVCLSYSLDSAFDSTLLWNPSIHKYAVLPYLPFTPPFVSDAAMDAFADANGGDTWMDIEDMARFKCSTIGFGYDNSKNDFKVARIWTPDPDLQTLTPLFSPKCEVYSAQQGLWRAVSITADVNILHLPRMRGTTVTGCFVNGTIHWLWSYECVLMFDCEREDFKIMELPKGFIRPAQLIWRTAELLEHAGMLSALVSTHLIAGGVCIELWAMEEHGVATTWRKLYSIHDGAELSGIRSYRPSFGKLTPYGPNQWSHWTKSRSTDDKFKRILSGHVYEESLFLMDHDKAHSYTKEEIISYQDFISKEL